MCAMEVRSFEVGQATLVPSDETLVHGMTRRTAAVLVLAQVYSRYKVEHGVFLTVESKDMMREFMTGR